MTFVSARSLHFDVLYVWLSTSRSYFPSRSVVMGCKQFLESNERSSRMYHSLKSVGVRGWRLEQPISNLRLALDSSLDSIK